MNISEHLSSRNGQLRKTLIVLSVWILFSIFGNPDLFAQNDSLPSFNQLRTPTSPVFVLLGVEPSSIERPNSPSDVAVSILNRTNYASSLPRDFAIEMSPYWLFSHPELSWSDDTLRNVLQSIVRTVTISVATAQIGDEQQPVTGLGASVRTSIVSGTTSGESKDNLIRAQKELGKQATFLQNMYSANLDKQLKLDLRNAGEDSAKKDTILQKYNSEKRAALEMALKDSTYIALVQKGQSSLQDLAAVREGFMLELSAGIVMNYPNNSTDSGKVGRYGVWLTPSYQTRDISTVGVIRFIGNNIDPSQNVFDIGGRIIYTNDKYALSLEGVFRKSTNAKEKKDLYRIAGNFEYLVLKNVWLQTTFGRDYTSSTNGSLIAQLGLAFNFSKDRFSYD